MMVFATITTRRCCQASNIRLNQISSRLPFSQIRFASTSSSQATSSSNSNSTITASVPAPSKKIRSIAVVGAGLSGLTFAYHLARCLAWETKGKLKTHRIVVYDSADRVGGWVHSQRLLQKGKGSEESVLFEYGPRSIRMAGIGGLTMLELIGSLKLGDQVISVPKSAPSAQRRMISYGDRLHLLPFDYMTLFNACMDGSHILHKLDPLDVLNIFKVGDRKPIRQKFPDESVEEFITRMISPKDRDGNLLEKDNATKDPPAVIEYMLSAMLHGIYAADPSQLSMRSTFPQIYHPALALDKMKNTWLPFPFNTRMKPYFLLGEEGEQWAKVELAKNRRNAGLMKYYRDLLGKDVVEIAEKTSVMSFKNGIQTLTDGMANACREMGVEFKLNSNIEQVKLQEKAGKGIVQLKDQSREEYDRVISTVPSTKLQTLLSDVQLPNLTANRSATVCVVNMAFPPRFKVRSPQAFGFLIPRASAKEGANPLGHLGTVFDSEAVPGQDNYVKYTMMFGGPFWKPGYGMYDAFNNNQNDMAKSEETAIELAMTTIAADFAKMGHDLTSLTSPDVIKKATLQKDCIPTYGPGHLERMNDLHETLLQKNLPLSVVGASYTGISLNDCVVQAISLANRTVKAEKTDESKRLSGLEGVLGA